MKTQRKGTESHRGTTCAGPGTSRREPKPRRGGMQWQAQWWQQKCRRVGWGKLNRVATGLDNSRQARFVMKKAEMVAILGGA
jgi:hypothetical protein